MKKHKKKLVLILGLIIAIIGLNVTFTYSKYIANNVYNYFLNSKEFYFTSDTLDSDTLKNVNTTWDGNDVMFTLKNAIGSSQITEYDIKYKATCKVEGDLKDKVLCAFTTNNSDTLEGTLSSYEKCINNTNDEVDVTDYNKTKCELGNYVWSNQVASQDIAFKLTTEEEIEIDDVTVVVEVESTEPYRKKISGSFYLHKGEVVTKEIKKYYDSYDNFDMLTISNLFEEPKCQKLSFDSELFRLDGNIDEYESYTLDDKGYINSITLKLPASQDIALKFYKTTFDEIYSVDYFTLEESDICQ
jgi:hypothetical protein